MALSPDHLVYAAPDLDKAVDKLTALLGVRPSAGGQHPNGTHNALLSLNQSCYLEVIAPDPAQCSGESGEPLAFGLDELHVGKLTTWAVLAPSLEEVAQAAQAAGYDPGVIVEGGRTRPDGVELRWRTTKRPEAQESWPPPGDGLVPFLIEWGEGTPHPAKTSTQGARLLELSLFHPRPAEVQPMLSALHIDILVAAGPAAAMRARLETPNGIVTLE
ncbi:MAG: VOC family protein [Caldilineaceae bacterium]|nr:VOC family protein [Caldilineaceae bacterium]MCY4091086.1 VOC family protein [Caldilineaceae bacterium]MCY4115571.1 VOC family protein [Caldilineaceae bacterium]MDE0070818.1 VOC family protein [Caldilineaceae bacterium]